MSGSCSSVFTANTESLSPLSCVLMVRAHSFKFYIHQWWLNKPYRVGSKSSQRGGPAVGRKRQTASNIHETWMYNLSHCEQTQDKSQGAVLSHLSPAAAGKRSCCTGLHGSTPPAARATGCCCRTGSPPRWPPRSPSGGATCRWPPRGR